MFSSEQNSTTGLVLLTQARRSLNYAAENQSILKVNLNEFPRAVQAIGATFVTLEKKNELRGCIGSLEAQEPLIVDVTQNAFQAALHDPRFMPVRVKELSDIKVSVSVLSKPAPMQFNTELELLQQIQPGIDGLIFEAYGQRGTFLPAVWESLPDPVLFLQHLKQKAGFPPDFWDERVRVYRYTTEKFSE